MTPPVGKGLGASLSGKPLTTVGPGYCLEGLLIFLPLRVERVALEPRINPHIVVRLSNDLTKFCPRANERKDASGPFLRCICFGGLSALQR